MLTGASVIAVRIITISPFAEIAHQRSGQIPASVRLLGEAGFLLANSAAICYPIHGTASNGRRLAPGQGAASCPLILGKGGCPMVTYSDLIQTGILVVGIIGLFIAANKKK